MDNFIAIDFETGNPKRVSACALGYAVVAGGEIVDTKGYLIKPVGGHAPFQSKIHGIKEEHTFDKPTFGELLPEIKEIFNYPLVAHSLFDKQVLNALSNHFNLGLKFDYIDSCCAAKKALPDLDNFKLNTLVRYFDLPEFKHHDAKEDAIACAKVFIKLQNIDRERLPWKEEGEFIGLAKGILADDIVNYKEAYALLYWLEDHPEIADQYYDLYFKSKEALEDDNLEQFEAKEIKELLKHALKDG